MHRTTKVPLGDGITLEMWVGSQKNGLRQLQNGHPYLHLVRVGNDTTLPKHIRVKAELPDGLSPLAFTKNKCDPEWQKTASNVISWQTALLSEDIHVIGTGNIDVRVHAAAVDYKEPWSGWKDCTKNLPVELLLEVL